MCLVMTLFHFFAPVLRFSTQPGKEQTSQPGPALFLLLLAGDPWVHHRLITPPPVLAPQPQPDKPLAPGTVSCSAHGLSSGGQGALGHPEAGLERMQEGGRIPRREEQKL